MTNCTSCGGTMVSISGNIFRCEYCGKLYSNTNGELSAADPARLYSSAVNLAKSNNESSLNSAIETLEALGSYKDSSALANTYRGMIAQSRVEAEERRLETERQAELERIQSEKRAFEAKQKAKIRGIVIAAVSAVAIVAVVIIVINNSNKAASYNEALELYNAGQYEDAVDVFGKLGDYSDSAQYVSTINNFLKERDSKYEKGVGYYEKAAYSECITTLTEISGYLDSTDYIDKSVEALYQQATEKFDAGELEKAKELLGKIPESSSKHMDAELLLANIEEIITEQTKAANYEQAKAYYDNGEYDKAQNIFISLGNWGDSKDYVFEIGNIYYNRALELSEIGSYEESVQFIEYIDTKEKWDNYTLAIELKNNSINAYQEMIINNAEAIYKSDGSIAMSEFINSKVCSIFSQNEASGLINDINKKYLPTAISDCILLSNEHLKGDVDYNVTDVFGNTYEYGIKYFDPYNFSYTEMNYVETTETYYINKQYVHFSATIVPYKSGGKAVTFSIYADGNKVYSCSVDDQSRPQKIDLNITGVEELKIGFFNGYQGHFLLANPYLYKNY